jgi:hypothetical protein
MKWVLLGLVLSGCATGPGPSDARAALAAYAQATLAGDYDRAYDAMSADYRQKVSRAEFAQFLRDHRRDARAAAERVRGPATTVELRADVVGDGGDRLGLVYENGAWRLAEDPLELYGQRTPRECLRSFVRALERKRYDVLVRFVPKRWREFTTAQKLKEAWEGPQQTEVGRLVHDLRAHMADPITQEGDEARLVYGDAASVKLVREDGVWRVESPE